MEDYSNSQIKSLIFPKAFVKKGLHDRIPRNDIFKLLYEKHILKICSRTWILYIFILCSESTRAAEKFHLIRISKSVIIFLRRALILYKNFFCACGGAETTRPTAGGLSHPLTLKYRKKNSGYQNV